ncbi:MAG: hypothetical protein M3R00_05540, partial [Pseudomonadota bacterium]|nr:hypothetical protein [Pseudomonadota bacterium]
YEQVNDIELKLEEVRLNMNGDQYTPPPKDKNETTTITANLPISAASDPTTPEELCKLAYELHSMQRPQSCMNLLTAFWHLLDEQPYLIAEGLILISQCQSEVSTVSKGIHQQQAQINVALQTCKKALTLAIEHNFLPHINTLFYILCHIQNSLAFAIKQTDLHAAAFTVSLPKPIEQLEESSPYGLIYQSFAIHKAGFKKLLHQCEKHQFAIDTHKYEFTAQHPEHKVPNHQLRFAKGLQVFFPNKHIRSNSLGSFDGYIEPKSYNPRF